MGESALNQIQLPLVTEEYWAGDHTCLFAFPSFVQVVRFAHSGHK